MIPRLDLLLFLVALALVRANSDMKSEARRLGIQSIIRPPAHLVGKSAQSYLIFLEHVLTMEYGAAETGAMAYTDPYTGNYQVFWDDFHRGNR